MLENAAKMLNIALPFVYGAATLAYLINFMRNRTTRSRLDMATLGLALLTSLAQALVHTQAEGHIPLASMGESLAFFALCTTAVYAYLEMRTGTQALGIFVIGLAFLFQLAASMQFQMYGEFPDILRSAWFAIHASTAILSFSGFSIATVMSVLYLLLYRELHRGRPGYIFRRIPSLEALDEMARRGVQIGFVLFTIGMVTGSIWAHQAWDRYWSWDPKQCTSFTVWLVYGIYLFLRARRGWTGRRIAFFAVAGFVLLIFTFVIVEQVFPTAHKFV
jgi:cytochrome c-type biogenesis protein CcsB